MEPSYDDLLITPIEVVALENVIPVKYVFLFTFFSYLMMHSLGGRDIWGLKLDTSFGFPFS